VTIKLNLICCLMFSDACIELSISLIGLNLIEFHIHTMPLLQVIYLVVSHKNYTYISVVLSLRAIYIP